MIILKLNRIKLVPIFVVAFCIAITSCTQNEIVPEVIEQGTTLLDLKTTEVNGELAERAACGSFRNACYQRLNNARYYLRKFSGDPSDHKAGLVKIYFNDYVDLLNDCIPNVNLSRLRINGFDACYEPNYIYDSKGDIINFCNVSVDVFEYVTCKIGNYVASGGSNPSIIEDLWNNELLNTINCYAHPPINLPLDLY